MSVLNEIYEGWKNFIFQSPEVEVEAKRRIEICAGNPELNIKKCDHFRNNKTCGKCGCYMPAKARSPKSICPIGAWKK